MIDLNYIQISSVNPSQPSQQHSSTQRPTNIQQTADNDGRGWKRISRDNRRYQGMVLKFQEAKVDTSVDPNIHLLRTISHNKV
jgi:hypothetical protein